jgi:hypothetical protein
MSGLTRICPACLQLNVTIPFRSVSTVAMANHIRITFDKEHVDLAHKMGDAMHEAAAIAQADWIESTCK